MLSKTLILATCVLAIVVASSEARLGRRTAQPGSVMCCQAMTEACLACHRANRRAGFYDAMEEDVGGGRVYGEYNKGPYKAGAEYNWDAMEENVGGGRVYGEYNKGPYKAGAEYNWDAMEENVGGGRVYGEYNKGPYTAGAEYNWDQSAGRRLSSSWLYTLATAKLNSGPTGSCVATTLGNMDRLGVPSFSGGTTADPNNSRGAMVQMIKAGRWTSKNLPGSSWKTIRSAYGTVGAYVIGADAYEKMAYNRQIPSGAIIFQTKWGWGASSGASGNDMGIVRDRGRYTFNYKLMSPIIYSNAKEVVILVPR